MKIFFSNQNKNKTITYTYRLLEYLAERTGHKISSPEDSDIIAISLNSFYELHKLRSLRKKWKDKKIIVGGHISYSPYPLLRYADFVNLGQGFEFFEKCKNISDLYDKDFIIHKNKLTGNISHYVNWDLIPCIQIGKNSYSYLWSFGCKNKCSFCLTSWMNKYQVNPNKSILRVLRKKLTGKQLYCITNDYSGSDYYRTVTDVTIKEYNEIPQKFSKIQLIRAGLESVTEKGRKFFNKPITDEEVKEFFLLTKKYKKRCNVFLILGYETEEFLFNFKEILGIDYDAAPKIGFICNYFNPNIGTPLEDEDITKIKWIRANAVKYEWKKTNGRVILFRDTSIKPINSHINTLMERSPANKIEDVFKLKKKVYKEYSSFWDDCNEFGLMDIAKGFYKKPEIKFPYKKAKEKIKKKIYDKLR